LILTWREEGEGKWLLLLLANPFFFPGGVCVSAEEKERKERWFTHLSLKRGGARLKG
jgi:hypothetical protein